MENLESNLYPRQSNAVGLDINSKIFSLNVFIYGMRGLGVEISKNLIKIGPKQVTLYDDNICTHADLGSNYFISENDIGKISRAEASLNKLKELNTKVIVSVFKGELAHNFGILKEYEVVVISELISRSTAESLNTFCREHKIGFIYCASLGLSGFSFTDFGEDFVTKDTDGEESTQYSIKTITRSNPGIVTIDDKKLRFSNGDYISFKEISGMTELNDSPPRPIKILSSNSFTIEDTSKFSEYSQGGFAELVKIPKPLFSKSLKECFENILKNEFDFMYFNSQMDMSKPHRNELLHFAFLSLHEFFNNENRMPYLNNKDDCDKVIELGKIVYVIAKEKKRDWALNLGNMEVDLIRNVARWSRAQIPSVCSFLGGVVSQEVIKQTGKFTPINQWLLFDFFELVGVVGNNYDTNKIVEKKNKLQEQIAVFGNELVDSLLQLKILNFGHEEILQEIQKLFYLMTISKNDNITNILENDSSIFEKDNSFWENQDLILFNSNTKETKEFFVKKCSDFNKPLIDINTFNFKAYSQVYVPDKTNYLITLEEFMSNLSNSSVYNFSHLFNDCEEWAKSLFKLYLVEYVKDLNELLFLEDMAEEEDLEEEDLIFQILNKITKNLSHIQSKEKLNNLKKLMEIISSNNYEKCIELAVFKFSEIFDFKIKQLLIKFPVDTSRYDENNLDKFWHGIKRIPNPISLDLNEDLHINFIFYFSNLISKAFNISNKDYDIIRVKTFAKKLQETFCSSFSIVKVLPQNSQRSSINKNQDLEEEKEIKIIKDSMLYLIDKIKNKIKFNENEYIKEDDFERGFVDTASFLRAQNYKLREVFIYFF